MQSIILLICKLFSLHVRIMYDQAVFKVESELEGHDSIHNM